MGLAEWGDPVLDELYEPYGQLAWASRAEESAPVTWRALDALAAWLDELLAGNEEETERPRGRPSRL